MNNKKFNWGLLFRNIEILSGLFYISAGIYTRDIHPLLAGVLIGAGAVLPFVAIYRYGCEEKDKEAEILLEEIRIRDEELW